jgi:hypothetical protein
MSFMPKELATDPDFLNVLNGQFKTAIAAIASNDKAHDKKLAGAFSTISTNATNLATAAKSLGDVLPGIPADVAAQPAVAQLLPGINTALLNIRFGVPLIVARPNPQTAGTLANQTAPALETSIQSLITNLTAASQPGLVSQMQPLLAQIAQSRQAIQEVLKKLQSPVYEERARKTLAPGHRALDVFLHDLNVYSIAPVAIFDVARVWPVDMGVRYGVGGGLRFSLVNVNFTMAYAVNPSRAKPEGAGAFFFKLDVTDLLP